MAEPDIPYAVPVGYGCLVPDEGHPEVGTPCPASAADSILTETHIAIVSPGRAEEQIILARSEERRVGKECRL